MLLAVATTAALVVAVTKPFSSSTPRTRLATLGSADGAVPPTNVAAGATSTTPTTATTPTTVQGDDTSGTLPAITPPVPGAAQVVFHGPTDTGAVALTFDDGYCDACVAGLVAGAERTGAHVTFCPNGVYGTVTWDKYATRIRALIAKGQVAICNHTWDHHDLTKMSAEQITTELTRNEAWIEQEFGVTSRPYYRPPYGFHNAVVDRIAAQIGYTQVLIWSGSLSDSTVQTPQTILDQMKKYDTAGTIILGHANHPATAAEFDTLVQVATATGLKLVTIPELLRSTA